MNIYVGNLADAVSEHDLERLFEQYGEVLSATVIKESATGTPKGFGFVEMFERVAAENALKALNGFELKGRKIVVNEAKPKTKR